MSISTGAISVGTTAAEIVPGNSRREAVTIQNTHATQDLYIGGTDVSTGNGLKLIAGASYTFENSDDAVWGVGSGAATTGRYLVES